MDYNEKKLRFFWEDVRGMDLLFFLFFFFNDKTERARELGREEIGKGNQ